MLTFQEGLSGQGIFPLLDRVLFVYLLIFYSTLLFYSRRKIIKEESIIRKVLLDLSTKHTRLEVRELSERTNSDADTLKKVALEMIENNEIFARYFSASRSIVFNQEANTEEIDRLLSLYQKWEEKQVGKI